MKFGPCLAFVVAIGLIFCVAVNAQTQNECDGKPNGEIRQINCHWYKECINETLVHVKCAPGEVFERKSMTCKDAATADTACGKPGDCSTSTPDKLYYPDDDIYRCETFILCINSFYYGRFYCSITTVFNGEACAQIYNVPPPCGTYVPPVTP